MRWGIGFGLACLLVFAVLFASGNRVTSDWQTTSLVLAGLGLVAMAVPALLVERRLVEFDASADAPSPSASR